MEWDNWSAFGTRLIWKDHIEKLINQGRLPKNIYKSHLNRAFETVDHIYASRRPSSCEKMGPVVLPFDYVCLECPETGSSKAIDSHAKKAGHALSLHAHSRTLYCAACRDLVYDPAAEAIRTGESDSSLVKSKKRKLSEANGQDSFMTDNTSQRECGQEGVRGLFNLGETCYMNSILQMMLHSQLLCSYFLGNGHPVHACVEQNGYDAKTKESTEEEDEESAVPKIDYQPCVSCGISDVFAESNMAEKTDPIKAVDLMFASWKAIPHMAGKGQQDAQEYYVMLVDKLHESAALGSDVKSRCNCFFHKIFFGRSRSEVTCDSCATTSETHDAFSAISLDFQKQFKRKKKAIIRVNESAVPDLHSALQTYISPEMLTAEDYTCRGCGVPRCASKRLKISKLPAILCIHVKRFGARMVGASYVEEKHEGKIDFPLSIDMAPYISRKKAGTEKGLMYDLSCVVVHHGPQIQNGHYLAFCKQEKRWYRFDDEIVAIVTMEEVLGQEAYLLFYSLRDMRTPESVVTNGAS